MKDKIFRPAKIGTCVKRQKKSLPGQLNLVFENVLATGGEANRPRRDQAARRRGE